MTHQNRKHDRIDSLNLLNYVCLDEKGKESIQGMGRTLNVSRGGILLETHITLASDCAISLTIGFEDELVDITGKVVYSRKGNDKKYESGIEFSEINETELKILNKYIIAFREQQK